MGEVLPKIIIKGSDKIQPHSYTIEGTILTKLRKGFLIKRRNNMKKKFLAFLIICMILLAQFSVFASEFTNSADNKITDELKQVMDNTSDDEYISIYIWLYDYGDELVYAYLSQKIGATVTAETENIYINNQIEQKVQSYNDELSKNKTSTANEINKIQNQIDEFRNFGKISESITNDELKKGIEKGKTFKEIVIISEKNQFLSNWRHSRQEVNEQINKALYNKLNHAKCKNITIDLSLPYIELECQKSYIYTISKMSEVKEIGYSEIATIVCDVENKTEAVQPYATPSDDLNHMDWFGDLEYDGYGVKIGVIETDNSYDSNHPHLKDANITVISGSTTQNDSVMTHPSKVLSILCGQNLHGYSGVAPEASVYFAGGGSNNIEVRKLLYLLTVERNVSIINMSLHYNFINYTNDDQYFDCFIKQYRTTIVLVSANTNYRVCSPGLAYNAITVGNVSNTVDEEGYLMNSESSGYSECHTAVTNKPEISAPGTDIYMFENNSNNELFITNYGSGTSAAAPMVSGTIALMMEANPSLIGKPDSVKAVLMSSAHNDAISTVNNPIVSQYTVDTNYNITAEPLIREKSGAGLLNIEGAIQLSLSNILYRFEIPVNELEAGDEIYIDKFYIMGGVQLETGLTFEKQYHDKISSEEDVKTDFDIEIYTFDDQKLACSSSSINNAELARFTFGKSGTYVFKIKCAKNNISDETPPNITDVNGNVVEHQSHDKINITFILSCVCDSPDIYMIGCNRSGHDVYCRNSGPVCHEYHDVATTTQQYDDATIKYDVYYKIRPFSNTQDDIICIYDTYPIIKLSNSTNTATYEKYSSEIKYETSKLWQKDVFRITIVSSENQIIKQIISTVYINIYYQTRECTFENTN